MIYAAGGGAAGAAAAALLVHDPGDGSGLFALIALAAAIVWFIGRRRP